MGSMKSGNVCLGLLAHVDAGKTTLSESLLYLSGAIRKKGRVDHGDTFLDTDSLERERGITIFSKQAELQAGSLTFTLMDTPGHRDFSPEMERTLQILDEAVLVISAADGVTGQVRNLWKLLKHYDIPTFIFVNKMDQPGTDRKEIFRELQSALGPVLADVTDGLETESVQEDVAVCDDALMERFLDGVPVTDRDVRELTAQRKLVPVWFGSALKMDGVDRLLSGLERFTPKKEYPDRFGARVFKINRDENRERLTWFKITGGTLRVKETVSRGGREEEGKKINQIRIYSGASFRSVQEVRAGQVCAVTGLADSRIGEGYGAEQEGGEELLQPVFSSEVILRPEEDRMSALQKIRILEEEEPMLHVRAEEQTGRIFIQVMGEVQMEILKKLLLRRFGLRVEFGSGQVVYRETIAAPAEGIGHYEPLRHYAEVHLLLEPGVPGSGIQFASACSTDVLAGNWQRLVLTALEEKTQVGVLTGAPLTDIRITLIGGRAHEKHTEGGDFRQAACRAVRQGLMQTKSILLEPVYQFRAELPAENAGRLMNDMRNRYGSAEMTETETVSGSGTQVTVTGTVPASSYGSYQQEFTAYTHGNGRIAVTPDGYRPCHNAQDVILEKNYDPDADTGNPSGSVFCSHGAGTFVPWNMVPQYAHVETGWGGKKSGAEEADREGYSGDSFEARQEIANRNRKTWQEREKEYSAGEEELKAIFERTYGPVKTRVEQVERPTQDSRYADAYTAYRTGKAGQSGTRSAGKAYFLVDGYNIIFSWDDLRELASVNMDAARDKLIELMQDYQGYLGETLILVFDAYRVKGGRGEVQKNNNIYVVYTREAETADAYIEKTVHELGHRHRVTVASSDGLEQVIILGEGAVRMSARELRSEIVQRKKRVGNEWKDDQAGRKNYLLDHADAETAEILKK